MSPRKSREQKDRCMRGTFYEKWRCCELWAPSLCCLSRILPLICLRLSAISWTSPSLATLRLADQIATGPKIPSKDYLSWVLPCSILNTRTLYNYALLVSFLVSFIGFHGVFSSFARKKKHNITSINWPI